MAWVTTQRCVEDCREFELLFRHPNGDQGVLHCLPGLMSTWMMTCTPSMYLGQTLLCPTEEMVMRTPDLSALLRRLQHCIVQCVDLDELNDADDPDYTPSESSYDSS